MRAAAMNISSQQPLNKLDLILGMGATGCSVAAWLSAQRAGFDMADSRLNFVNKAKLCELYPEAQMIVGELDGIDLASYARLIVSPGVPPTLPIIEQAKQLQIPVIGDIELFAETVSTPVIAVTGSNGKSTVVHLLSKMCSDSGMAASLGGNFGIPALDLLNDPAIERHILELSSFQLETTFSLRADAAVVLNISEDHMDRYDDLSDYVYAKGKIYEQCKIAVVNRDDDYSVELAAGCDTQVSFGLDQPVEGHFGIIKYQQQTWLAKGHSRLIACKELKILGQHNQSNALAALALAEAGGVPIQTAVNTLRSYTGLPHRTQWVAEQQGVTWLNDSKATNVGAAIAALQGLDHPVVLIAGGQGKGADFSALKAVVETDVKAVVLMGEDAEILFRALQGSAAISLAINMQDAVAQAAKLASPGDYVLLSPACASFDQYSGYADRGETFIRCVETLTGEGS